jgi:hypothetical protein
LRAALCWFLDQDAWNESDAAAEREAGLRLGGALGYFCYVRGYDAEGRRWLGETLARVPEGVESVARLEVRPTSRSSAQVAVGRSALYGVLVEIEALSLDLVELRRRLPRRTRGT